MTKDLYLDYITYEKRCSQHTLTSYRTDLDQFFHFIEEQYEVKEINEVTHHMIRSWIVNLLENGISPRSVGRKITTLKSYYRFLLKEKLVTDNPMLRIVTPKSPQRLPGFVETDDMRQLLEEVVFGDDFNGYRDHLVLEMLYSTGMRLSEMIGLRLEDIDLPRRTLKVTGKRNKQRLIPFSKKLEEAIRKYLPERDKVNPGPEGSAYLFITSKGKRLYPRMIYRIVNVYLSRVTTISKKSPHVIRHTFATHMLNNGADLNAIKEILGHASLSATQVYTHNTFEKLISIYKQAHPRA